MIPALQDPLEGNVPCSTFVIHEPDGEAMVQSMVIVLKSKLSVKNGFWKISEKDTVWNTHDCGYVICKRSVDRPWTIVCGPWHGTVNAGFVYRDMT